MNQIRILKRAIILEFDLWSDIQDFLVMKRFDKAKRRANKYRGEYFLKNVCWSCQTCILKVGHNICSDRERAFELLRGGLKTKGEQDKCFKFVTSCQAFYLTCLIEMELANRFFFRRNPQK